VTALPIAFRSDVGRFNEFGSTKLINAYAEKQGNDAKAPLAVLPADGLVQFAMNGDTPCRGLIYLPDLDKIHSIHSSSAYKNLSDGSSVRIGTIPGIDPVQLSRNQKADPQVLVQAQAGTQIIESDSASYLLDEDVLSTVVTADTVSDYGVLGFADRGFQLTSLNSYKTVAALDFATFEQKAGKLIRVQGDRGELFGFKNDQTEVWRNTGNADFPFQPLSTIQRGLMAKNALVTCDNTLMFVGDDGVVYRLNNYAPQRISTHYIERLIQEDDNQADILAFSWTRGGHAFACFSGTDWTVCYDAATGVWHNRESYGYSKWRVRHAVQAWGKTILGDRQSGKLFYLDSNTYTEDGGPMIWGVDSPPMHAFPNGGICDALHLDLATGHGTLSGQGANPKIMLQVSRDGGNTFEGYRELELGVTGNYQTRVTARRLGRFGPKGMVFRLRISDPVARGLVAADAVVRPLRR
jgi:Phage stabilisation protein.